MSSIHSCGLSSRKQLPGGSTQKSRLEPVCFGHQACPFVTTRPAANRVIDSQLSFSPCQAAVSLQRSPFGLQAASVKQPLACWCCNNSGENHSLELQRPKALTLLLRFTWHLGSAPAPFQQLSVTSTHTHSHVCTQTHIHTNAHAHTHLIQGRTLSQCLAHKEQTLQYLWGFNHITLLIFGWSQLTEANEQCYQEHACTTSSPANSSGVLDRQVGAVAE